MAALPQSGVWADLLRFGYSRRLERVSAQCLLMDGCRDGDADSVLAAIDLGADVNACLADWYPLHVAVHFENEVIVRMLLNLGARRDIRHVTGFHIGKLAQSKAVQELLGYRVSAA